MRRGGCERGTPETPRRNAAVVRTAATRLKGMTLDRSIGPRCNIGPAEVARRRNSAWVFTAVATVVAVLLVALAVPIVARLAIFPFATAAAITWLQVVHRFCVGFAALGIENLGRLGAERKVDVALRGADRRRAGQLVLEGSLVGAAVTLAVLLLPT